MVSKNRSVVSILLLLAVLNVLKRSRNFSIFNCVLDFTIFVTNSIYGSASFRFRPNQTSVLVRNSK